MNVELVSPFPFEALPRVWGWMQAFKAKVQDDFAPKTLISFMEHMESGHRKSWAVLGDGELGGLITFERLSPWLGTAHITLKQPFQGQGIAVPVCRRAVSEMFESGIGKLSFYPLAGNLAIGSLLVNIGAKREGKLEAHTLCNGKPTDVWVYGLIRESFEEKQHATSNHTLHSGDHRSGGIDRGLVPVGTAEDFDQHEPNRVEL